MANKRKREQKNYSREAVSFILIALAIILFLSLLSYDRADDPNLQIEVLNELGRTKIRLGNYHNAIEILQESANKAKIIGNYFNNKLQIKENDSVLDYGCGTALVLSYINSRHKFGIDISYSMLNEAYANEPRALYLQSDRVPYIGHIDYIISNGVFQYLPSLLFAQNVLFQMNAVARKGILITGIPNEKQKEQREKKRDELGKKKHPPHLYYPEYIFRQMGYEVFPNEFQLYNYNEFEFGVLKRT